MSAPDRTLLVLRDPPGKASWNMALDEALLEDAGSSWLRFYTWAPHALSLGYFQQHADFAEEASLFDLVRRPTGGGAILHAHELTFSLALPEAALPGTVRSSYGRINTALKEALAGLGVALHEPEDCRSSNAMAAWCFAAPVGLDLVQADGRKVVGCAQRRRDGRILHHGSLILKRHPHTPFTGSLEDCGLADASPLADRICEAIASELGRPALSVEALPVPISDRARAIEASRYSSDDWTSRR